VSKHYAGLLIIISDNSSNLLGERLKASREEWLKVKDRLDEEKDKVYNILEKVTEGNMYI
jgi:hypothetical protein